MFNPLDRCHLINPRQNYLRSLLALRAIAHPAKIGSIIERAQLSGWTKDGDLLTVTLDLMRRPGKSD